MARALTPLIFGVVAARCNGTTRAQQDGIEIHLFAEYCREHLCEDSIIFLLEAKSFQLLFDPRDRLAEARRIFETFLDMGSESRIAASNSVVAECKTVCRVVSALLLCPPMSNRNAVRCPQD